MSASAAVTYLGRTDRTLRRYKQEGRLRMRLQHGRVQYHRADLESLKDELRIDDRPRAPEQAINLMPSGDLLNLVRDLQQQLAEATHREGLLKAQLGERPILPIERTMQERLDELAHELDELKRRVNELEAKTARP